MYFRNQKDISRYAVTNKMFYNLLKLIFTIQVMKLQTLRGDVDADRKDITLRAMENRIMYNT